MGQRLEPLQPDAVLRSALRRPICSSNPLPCCARHMSVLMYFRGLLNCRMEAAQQVVYLAAARPRHAIGSHGVDCQSVKQMSNDRNTRIENLFLRLPISFNMVYYARRSSTAYDNIAVFADFVTCALCRLMSTATAGRGWKTRTLNAASWHRQCKQDAPWLLVSQRPQSYKASHSYSLSGN